MKGYGPETFGQLNAEGYDDEHDAPHPAETSAAVQTLFNLASGGSVLEFAVALRLTGQDRSVAELAGLELRERWGDWDRSPFTASSARHVSAYGWV
jgi:hypothetical protein